MHVEGSEHADPRHSRLLQERGFHPGSSCLAQFIVFSLLKDCIVAVEIVEFFTKRSYAKTSNLIGHFVPDFDRHLAATLWHSCSVSLMNSA